MARLLDSPLLVLLIGVAALSMLVPGLHAWVAGELRIMGAFLQSGLFFLVITLLLWVATRRYQPRHVARSQLFSLLAAYAVLPLMLAVPLVEAVEGLGFVDAWFEMVSSFTTTGATVFDLPARIPDTVHLWRALVGWLGGFFVLVAAMAILAPLNLGGFELLSGRGVGRSASRAVLQPHEHDASARLVTEVARMAPVYAGLTGALWLGLILAGAGPMVAVTHAMSTMSTSGISPVQGMGAAGIAGEVLILLFLIFAITRRSLPGLPRRHDDRLVNDSELRLALILVACVTFMLFLRQLLGAIEVAEGENLPAAGRALWGGAFTAASFLSTTGFVSNDWGASRLWSGLASPGLILLGLALMGGGVATTAGGLKLLRVHALFSQGQREVERLVYPSSVGGGGARARQLRRAGGQSAWLFLMLFAISAASVLALLTLLGMTFETALVFTVAALTTTGPLAGVATELPLSWAVLGTGPKLILGATMILGRLEMLLILALFLPDIGRR